MSGLDIGAKSKQVVFDISALAAETAARLADKAENAHQRNVNKSILKIDVEEAVVSNALTKLITPTYDGSGDATHPCVRYFPNKWNGYHYWMAMTPYHLANSAWENPSILVSDDGITWIVPSGVTNPIEPAPGSGYNSDTNLCLDKDGITLHLIWRATGATEVIYVRSSTDGINWSPKVPILSIDSTIERNVSPSIVWDGTQYIMWTVDIVANPIVVKKRICTDIKGVWSVPVVSDLIAPSGRQFWHLEVLKYSNQFIMLITVATIGSNGVGGSNLHLATSLNGDNWILKATPLMQGVSSSWCQGLYKSAFQIMQYNNEVRLALWYTSTGPSWCIGYSEIQFNKSQLRNIYNVDLLNALHFLCGDLFNRTDSTTSLGTATSGQTWSVLTGGFGIIGKKAYVPIDANNSKAVLDIGISDFYAGVEFPVVGTQSWFIFRCTDDSNYFRLGNLNGNIRLQTIIAGTSTELSLMDLCSNGDRVSVQCNGSIIQIFINGMFKYQVTSTFNQTATKIGIQTNQTIVRFANIYAKSLS